MWDHSLFSVGLSPVLLPLLRSSITCLCTVYICYILATAFICIYWTCFLWLILAIRAVRASLVLRRWHLTVSWCLRFTRCILIVLFFSDHFYWFSAFILATRSATAWSCWTNLRWSCSVVACYWSLARCILSAMSASFCDACRWLLRMISSWRN